MNQLGAIGQWLSRNRATLGFWGVYLFAAWALYWVFHDLEWSTLVQQVRDISLPWIVAIIALDVLSFYVQGVRWQLLLRSSGQISSLKTTQAIYIGLFASEVLPLRVGEIIRGILVSRWIGRKFADVLPSMAVERLLDGLWFSSSMAIVALLVPIPGQIRTITTVVFVLATLGMAVFAWVAVRSRRAPQPAEIAKHGKLRAAVERVIIGLKEIGFSSRFWGATVMSGLLHVVQALALLAILKACGIDLPIIPLIAVFLIVHLGIAIPNAPANVGTFQLFCVLGLTFFGIEKSTAAAVSLIAFSLLTFPVLLIGLLATLYAGLSLTSIRSQIRQVTQATPATEPGA